VLLYWGKSRDIEMVATVGLNLQVICSMLLMIQGMAVAFFYARKYDVPKLILWIFIVMAVTNGFIMQMTVFTGAFDIVFDFRRLRRPRIPPPPENTDGGED